jgi:DNA-binding NtrC family response regulator
MEHARPEDLAPSPPVVLVVENDSNFRELLQLILLPLDVEVIAVADIEGARRHLHRKPALIILDFYLEPTVGTDLLDEVPDDVPVLLLTASLETREILRKYPRITAALQKPVREQQLHDAVKSLLGGSKADPPA